VVARQVFNINDPKSPWFLRFRPGNASFHTLEYFFSKLIINIPHLRSSLDRLGKGPNMTTTQPPMENPSEQLTAHEKEIFNYLLRPDDSYNPDGVYWADLPLVKRIKFVTSYDAQEWKRELSSIGRMFVKDPLSPIGYYFRNMVIPGAGLGLEGLSSFHFSTDIALIFPIDMFCSALAI
jgi:hypothetical protein